MTQDELKCARKRLFEIRTEINDILSTLDANLPDIYRHVNKASDRLTDAIHEISKEIIE
jgi:hypothetical protein